MPPGLLGALTGTGFLAIFLARIVVIKKLVESSELIGQAQRQFVVEYVMVLLAGIFVILLNFFGFSVPLVNGIVYFIGFLAFGFFVSIDMSLEKERLAIESTSGRLGAALAPEQFYPLTRKFFIVALVTNLLVMVIIMLIIARDLSWLAGMDINQMAMMMKMTTNTIFKEILFVISVLLIQVINILYSYSKNLSLLFDKETGVLESVTNGDLSKLVPVATRDEFGLIATNTNKMILGLRDRIRLLSRLSVAKEVQENLLPNTAPDFSDLDISGSSQYCEEVGGDYFDYFEFSKDKIGIILTDASGHGVGAGLHMTTIRAFLQYGANDYPGAKPLIESVNRHLTRDSFETGRFTTAFFVEINRKTRSMQWIRAGHEPAIFFTPSTGQCEKLVGKGMALGVDIDSPAHVNQLDDIETGSVLVIFSDGIKESRNTDNQMYGEKRIIGMIEKNAGLSAHEIEKKLRQDLSEFTGNLPIEDDITIVVVKFVF